MTDELFRSYSQNGEDVVLWRALGGVAQGRYIDVGAYEPALGSVSNAFYQRGWRGITIDPIHDHAEKHRSKRPGDVMIEAAISAKDAGSTVINQIAASVPSTMIDEIGAGHESADWALNHVVVPVRTLDDILSKAGWTGLDIHFMTVDVGGSEADTIASIDLRVWRPWVIVVESASHTTAAPSVGEWAAGILDSGYQFCLFDGLCRFYVAAEHADRLGHFLSYAPCILDRFESVKMREDAARSQLLTEEVIRWRTAALNRWSEVIASRWVEFDDLGRHVSELQAELAAVRRTLSWRITAPLRAARRTQRATNAQS